MWCYQKPGFEALLLAELQRQQQCSQFCDTLLRTNGVSVPAHSCILSAISPHISSALSSTPPPPAGQSRLLEFRALGGCTLLHMVRLLYCGEMAGEGEKEKQEAISAAARLGIHGLVEVTRRDCKRRHEEGEGHLAEVGVQTEPEENEGWLGRWRREVSDRSNFLWKETLSEGGRDTWMQTEELQASTAPPSQPAASYQTIDIATLQILGETNPTLLLPQIPYIPVSLPLPSSAPMQEATAAGHISAAHVAPAYTSVHPSLPSFAADPQSWWAGSQAEYITASNELEDERYEQFQGDIPGYINQFLNPDKKEGSRRRQSRGRQGTGEGGARRGGTGERRARRPRGRTGGRGRGRGGLMQTVDVQEVGVSKLQMLFLQRWGTRVTRTGQGGGAAGRRLHLKTRELLKPAKSRRRRARGKVWEFGPNGDVLCGDGGAGNAKRGRKNSTQQLNQDDLPAGRPQRATAKPTTSLSSFSSPPMRFYNVHTLSTSSPSLQRSPSDGLRSPAASFVSPASSLIHTTPVPPLAPPPHEEQPEHIDRLLEEVMMGLDILPNNNAALHPQPPVPAGLSTCASSSQTMEKQQGQVVAAARGGGDSSSANSEVPVLQQQGQGELNEMLEHFLLSFEQHVNSCAGREEVEVGGCREAPVRNSQITRQQQNEARRSQPRKASARSAAPSKHSEKPSGKVREPVKRRRKKRFNQYQFTFERKRVRVRTPASLSDAKSKMVHDQGDKLQQMPVVKLERSGPLPVRVTLQEDSCQSLDVKSLAKATTRSSSMKHGSLSRKNQPDCWSVKTYPIRSRFKEARMDSVPSPLDEPLLEKRPASAVKPGGRRGRPRKNGQPLSLCNEESSRPPIQTEPVEPCGTEELPATNQERHEEEITVQPQQEAAGPTKRGEKRGAESEEETSDGATVTKRVCFEQIQQPTSETLTSGSESAAVEIEDVMDVETVSLASEGGCLEREEKPVWSEIKQREIEEGSTDEEMESSYDTLIDVNGDEEEEMECRTAPTLSLYVKVKPYVSPASHSEVNQGSTGSWEDDIDVIGGSSPAPDPVIISWTESSEDEKEEEDEDVDVVGENTDSASAVVFATMSKGELVRRNDQTEVLLR